jgi:hypothetical protein
MRRDRVVIVVAPFGKMVCELQTGGISGGVFEIDNDELFVSVGWEKERRFTGRLKSEDIAILCLHSISSGISCSK